MGRLITWRRRYEPGVTRVGCRHDEGLCYVTGTRKDGSRVVLRSCCGMRRAEALAQRFRDYLEDYTTITAERVEGRLAAGDERRERD